VVVEAAARAPVERLNTSRETGVAGLDQGKERTAGRLVPPCDVHDQLEVRTRQRPLRLLTRFNLLTEFPTNGRVRTPADTFELVPSGSATLDRLKQS
jgi:hypothetical protein